MYGALRTKFIGSFCLIPSSLLECERLRNNLHLLPLRNNKCSFYFILAASTFTFFFPSFKIEKKINRKRMWLKLAPHLVCRRSHKHSGTENSMPLFVTLKEGLLSSSDWVRVRVPLQTHLLFVCFAFHGSTFIIFGMNEKIKCLQISPEMPPDFSRYAFSVLDAADSATFQTHSLRPPTFAMFLFI